MKKLQNLTLILLAIIFIIQLILLYFEFPILVFILECICPILFFSSLYFSKWIKKFGSRVIEEFEIQNIYHFICPFVWSLYLNEEITKFEYYCFVFFIKLNYPKDGDHKVNLFYIFSLNNYSYYHWTEKEKRIKYFKSLIE